MSNDDLVTEMREDAMVDAEARTLDLTPGSADWRKRITASKVAAILGLSPWESPRSLWHLMRGDVSPGVETDTHRRGHYLEPAILAWWRDRHPEFEALKQQPAFKLGDWAAATPDMSAYLIDPAPASGQYVDGLERQVLVEAKSTAMDWDGELPAYYLTQVIWQMHVSGIHRCYVPVIGPRLTFTEYVVDYADYAEDAVLIERRAREFYDSLAADTPPPLDDTVATYEAVRKVHPDIDKGEAVELSVDQARELVRWVHDAKNAEVGARLNKTRVLDLMGRAQYATHNGARIARRQPGKHGVTFVVTGKPEDLNDQKESA